MATSTDPFAPTVMECPYCGRLWVGFFLNENAGVSIDGVTFTYAEENQMRGTHRAPQHQEFPTCYGVPMRVYRADVQAAWILGGKEAAEALWEAQTLKNSIEEYERTCNGYR